MSRAADCVSLSQGEDIRRNCGATLPTQTGSAAAKIGKIRARSNASDMTLI